MALNVVGVCVMMAFYLLVLGTGIWASFKSQREARQKQADRTDMALLGNRGISLLVGVFTMTATWVGGGFIVGITEAVYKPGMGLVWATMPLTATVCFAVAALFFAEPMRDRKYVTMMDPFQAKYGRLPTAVLSLAALASEIMWVAGTLIGLGVTMSVILDLPYAASIWVSAAVAIAYTLLGGLYSVAYTDIVQLALIFLALWLCVPFALTNPATSDITTSINNALSSSSTPAWVGVVPADKAWKWIDDFLLLSLGNLGLQNFHQRTLSASSSRTAKITCYAAAVIVPTFGIPPVLLGAAAASTDWSLTAYGSAKPGEPPSPAERGESGLVLPLVLQHLTPPAVSIVGIGAVAAAVMSSTDSSLLSAASVFTSNVYRSVLRPGASTREVQWVIRASVVAFGLAGTALTFKSNSALLLWMLRADLTYTLMLPQLVCVLFVEASNGYGAVLGCVTGLVLRLLFGEPAVGLPATVCFPPGCAGPRQLGPVRTVCMLCSMLAIWLFSHAAALLFGAGLLPEAWDICGVKKKKKKEASPAVAAATDEPDESAKGDDEDGSVKEAKEIKIEVEIDIHDRVDRC